jgi:cytochrome b561
MSLQNSAEKFGSLTKLLHWSIAALFIAQFFLVYRREYMPENSPESIQYILLHKSVGMIVLFLGLIMIAWHYVGTRPIMPMNMSKMENIAAKTIHFLLYLCMLMMPITGYLMSSLGGYGVSVFGLKLPNPFLKNESLAHLFKEAHEVISFVIIAVVSIHILAALYHHFIRKDNVLKRML